MFFDLVFLFFIGACGGWVLELFFRRFFSAKKWINPGFLVGPCLPLYGFGLTGMYLLSYLFSKIDMGNAALSAFVAIMSMGVAMTVIEYIAGLIFIKEMHIKLWDYSDRWGNIQGIICPLFSVFWIILCALYYLLIHPFFVSLVAFRASHPLTLFFIGICVGIIFVDLCYSFKISAKISKYAKESQIVVKYERLKQSILEQLSELKEKSNFVLPFKSSVSIKDSIKRYINSKIGLSKKEKKELEEANKKTTE